MNLRDAVQHLKDQLLEAQRTAQAAQDSHDTKRLLEMGYWKGVAGGLERAINEFEALYPPPRPPLGTRKILSWTIDLDKIRAIDPVDLERLADPTASSLADLMQILSPCVMGSPFDDVMDWNDSYGVLRMPRGQVEPMIAQLLAVLNRLADNAKNSPT